MAVVASRSNGQSDASVAIFGWEEGFKGPNTLKHRKKKHKMETSFLSFFEGFTQT